MVLDEFSPFTEHSLVYGRTVFVRQVFNIKVFGVPFPRAGGRQL